MAISSEFSEILRLAKAKGVEAEFISAIEARCTGLKKLNNNHKNNDLDLAFQSGDPQDYIYEQYWEGIVNK